MWSEALFLLLGGREEKAASWLESGNLSRVLGLEVGAKIHLQSLLFASQSR